MVALGFLFSYIPKSLFGFFTYNVLFYFILFYFIL